MKNKTDSIYILNDNELALTKAKRKKTNQLCFAIMLKHFQLEGHHPQATKYINPSLITCIAQQLQINTHQLDYFNWEGRSTERYREEIRRLCGYHLANQSEIAGLKNWLAATVFSQGAKQHTHLAHAYTYFNERKIEPPNTQELIRHIQSAYRVFEEKLLSSIFDQLSPEFFQKIDCLIEIDSDNSSTEKGELKLKHIKKNIAGAKLKTVQFELEKLACLRALDIPKSTFKNFSRHLIKKYYARILAERPSRIQEHPPTKRYALMAMFCYYRHQYVIDNLIDLMLQLIHQLQTKSENFVKKKIIADVTRVNGKFDILYSLAEVAVNHPSGIIRDEIYSQVPLETLKSILKELSCKGKWFETQVHTKIHSLYSHSHRRVLLTFFEAFTFCSKLATSQPLLDAIAFIKTHRNDKGKYYANNGVLGIFPPKRTKTAAALDTGGLQGGYTFSTAP